jgi:hypothetical protein
MVGLLAERGGDCDWRDWPVSLGGFCRNIQTERAGAVMTDEEAKCARHDMRISQMETGFEKQQVILEKILSTLSTLSSYNIEVSRKVHAAVFGNGSPGLLKDMARIQERTDARKEQHDRDVKRIDMVLCWGGSTMAITMLAMIGYLFALHFGGK